MIVRRFGADALKVLETEPERLLEIRGITPAKLEDIKSSYAESRCLKNLMILLSSFQVTPTTAKKIYEHFGAKSVDILQNNPYEICQVSGFGFKRVDAIVRKGDTPMNSPMRIHGAIYAALDAQRNENGHLFLEVNTLIGTAAQLLNSKLFVPELRVKTEEISDVLEDMILQGEVVSSNGNIYQLPSFTREDEAARQIAKILSAPIFFGMRIIDHAVRPVYNQIRHDLQRVRRIGKTHGSCFVRFKVTAGSKFQQIREHRSVLHMVAIDNGIEVGKVGRIAVI
jgi:exodeoxyribonuclease V alpha subunit